jgi:hypothetical protein
MLSCRGHHVEGEIQVCFPSQCSGANLLEKVEINRDTVQAWTTTSLLGVR